MGTVVRRADRDTLYIKYRVAGRWVMRATKWRPGEEAQARAEVERLENPADTVEGWAKVWLDRRAEQGIRDIDNDRQRWRDHIEPIIGKMPLATVQPKNILAIVDRLRARDAAPRTIRNVYSIVKAMFRDARIDGCCPNDPCCLTHRQLGKVRDADLGWRADAVFSRQELESLISDSRLPLVRRVLWGLLGIGALRDGEACALRWGRLYVIKPLPRIVVVASHERAETKTGAERWMPMHPALVALMAQWRQGWREQMGRDYQPEDLVLPAPKATNRGPRKQAGSMLDKDWIWKRLQSDLGTLGLRRRRAHDLRRTFISLAKADGADELILRRGTHAPPKSIMGLYTSVDWETLCREVAKLKLNLFIERKRGGRAPDSDLARAFNVQMAALRQHQADEPAKPF